MLVRKIIFMGVLVSILSSCGLPTKESLGKAVATKDVASLSEIRDKYIDAIKDSDTQSLSALEKAGYKTINGIDKKGTDFPIHLAISLNRSQLIPFFQKRGYSIEKLNKDDQTPLMLAVKEGNVDVVKQLLKLGANPNTTNHLNQIALSFVKDPHVDIVDLLLKAKTDLRIKNSANLIITRQLKPGSQVQKRVDEAMKKLEYRVSQLFSIEGLSNPRIIDAYLKDGLPKDVKDSKFGFSPVFLAVLYQQPAALAQLLKSGFNPNATDHNGRTPLMAAVDGGNANLVSLLLKAKADPNIVDLTGLTALFWTMTQPNKPAHDYANIAKLLIAHGAKINFQMKDGTTPLLWSVFNHKPKTFAVLLAAKANPNLAKNTGLTPLMKAVVDHKIVMVRALLKAGANPNLALSEGSTALHMTMATLDNKKRDYADIAKLLIAYGANINQQNSKGSTPIYLSVLYNRPKTFALLLAAKADLSMGDNRGWTPLMVAVDNDRLSMIQNLIGANPRIDKNNVWTALLFQICRSGRFKHDSAKVAKLLIANGADINWRGKGGRTPVYLAAINNKPKILTVLLKAKADPNIGNQKEGWTPLMVAVDQNNIHTIKALLNAKADLNLKDKAGDTALMRAAYFGNVESARLLIRAGADITIANSQNKQNTALNYAIGKNHDTIVDLIVDKQAEKLLK